MKRKQPRPVAPVAVDPNAPVFEIGDGIEVKRRPLWTGYVGIVEKVNGGVCHVRIASGVSGLAFHADIPAAELKKYELHR